MKVEEALITNAIEKLTSIHFVVKNEVDEIETVQMQNALQLAISALEKQIPKKTKITLRGTTGYSTKEFCPVCNAIVYGNYCYKCGQALDRGTRK